MEEDHVDLIGAQVVLYGSYYDDDIDKDVLGFIEEWDMYDKNFNRDLNGYIINEFESRDYIDSYGYIYNDRNQFSETERRIITVIVLNLLIVITETNMEGYLLPCRVILVLIKCGLLEIWEMWELPQISFLI